MPKKFIWLVNSQLPRKGPKLVKGAVHAAADYSANVVEWWVKQGVAKWVTEKSKKEEKE